MRVIWAPRPASSKAERVSVSIRPCPAVVGDDAYLTLEVTHLLDALATFVEAASKADDRIQLLAAVADPGAYPHRRATTMSGWE